MVIPGPGPEPEPSERNGRFPKIEIVKSIALALELPDAGSYPVSNPAGESLAIVAGETLPIHQEPFLGAFTAVKVATYKKNGTSTDWGDRISFLQPALNAVYYPIAIMSLNPCPVPVFCRLVIQSYLDTVLIMDMEETIIINPSGKGLFFYKLPYLLSGVADHYYTMHFQAAEPFTTEEGEYLQAPLLFITSHVEGV